MKIVFFGDTHLDRKNPARIQFVETFVRDVCADADMVFILGDLFEFYHGYDGYIYPWYKGIVDAFKDMTGQGKSVYFLEGNHEFDMGPFFQFYTGIRCAKNVVIDVEGKRTFISHGDEFAMNPLMRLLKTPFIYGVMNLFGPRLSWRIAMGLSLFISRKKKGNSEKVMLIFRNYAGKKLGEGFDVVILAHSHMADRVECNSSNGPAIYLNTGDFIRDRTYVEYMSETGFMVKEYKSYIR
ncbi:MAG: UDP-2,3-diacylglucosamine hydrolase [Syntrophorhabdus sp. PtaU1.Bin002]|nr:MAG: UDP-2,3-diacylglucosamine hydrolase [Syntrophorhabdus sp. PtaU1.Bin002]